LQGSQFYAYLIVEINANRKRISPLIQFIARHCRVACGFVARLSHSDRTKVVLVVALLPDSTAGDETRRAALSAMEKQQRPPVDGRSGKGPTVPAGASTTVASAFSYRGMALDDAAS
jgi:hypothetical protein